MQWELCPDSVEAAGGDKDQQNEMQPAVVSQKLIALNYILHTCSCESETEDSETQLQSIYTK